MRTIQLNMHRHEDRIGLWYGLGLIAYFLVYLVMIFWTCYAYLHHPHSVSPSQIGSGYVAIRMHRRVNRFVKTKLIVRR